MRLVHLSDIHLSKDNFNEFQNNYKEALLNDLHSYHLSMAIDLILITGDLVDKGGYSLFEIDEFKDFKNPYDIFEKVFLDPIISRLGISKNNILFVPGNHDIDEREILLHEENQMIRNIDKTNINKYLSENKVFKHSHRIRKFKEFEEKYHKDNVNYKYTNNQSTYTYLCKDGSKVGFILINDSWRCKSARFHNEDETFFFGIQQFYEGLNILEENDTELNICLLHHSLKNYREHLEVERVLTNKKIELFLYGHYHSTKFEVLHTSSYKSSLGIRGRAALFKPEEYASEYQSGYQIIDIDLKSYKVLEINYRQYKYKHASFDLDTDAVRGGVDRGENGKGILLMREGRANKKFELNEDDFKIQ